MLCSAAAGCHHFNVHATSPAALLFIFCSALVLGGYWQRLCLLLLLLSAGLGVCRAYQSLLLCPLTASFACFCRSSVCSGHGFMVRLIVVSALSCAWPVKAACLLAPAFPICLLWHCVAGLSCQGEHVLFIHSFNVTLCVQIYVFCVYLAHLYAVVHCCVCCTAWWVVPGCQDQVLSTRTADRVTTIAAALSAGRQGWQVCRGRWRGLSALQMASAPAVAGSNPAVLKQCVDVLLLVVHCICEKKWPH
ncbi:hypothetical protein COO60DRAFT_55864 [Scenedesmus sp. NREL 46B-D3]|nr:hypothetical protein COO60DRAFT_55864 [Scenedesmus sp. NREL 46B-D3]